MSTDPTPTPSATSTGGATAPGAATPATPSAGPQPRRVVGTYPTHQEAERAVDWLSDEGFPVARTAIVGRDLRSVEQVTGRVTTGTAAGRGAAQGAVIGLFFAIFFGLFFTGPGFLGLLVYAVVMSALLGALLGAATHAMLGGTRDFATVAAMQADRYEVMVDEAVADEAATVLARLPAAR
jgi:hypothetical protein